MKRFFVFLVLAGWAYFCQAQEEVQGRVQPQGQEQVQPQVQPQEQMQPQPQVQPLEYKDLERKFVVKFVPVNIFLESVSFEAEGMINPKNAVTLGIGFPTNRSLNGKYGTTRAKDITEDKFGTTHIRAAYRHYTGKKMLPKGFYYEPYLKYQKIDFSIKGKFTGTDDLTYNAEISSKLNTLSLGFQIGVQFLIANRVAIDCYFLGVEGGLLSGDVNAQVIPNTYVDDMKTEIDNSIKDLPSFISNKLTTSQSNDAVNVNAKSVPYPWLRFGVSIGFAF